MWKFILGKAKVEGSERRDVEKSEMQYCDDVIKLLKCKKVIFLCTGVNKAKVEGSERRDVEKCSIVMMSSNYSNAIL